MATTSTEDGQRLAGVSKVNDNDIICGRGGLALKHPGNMAYRKIVGLNKEIYATCLKTEKLRISKSIVAAIREINGRFLEREDGKTSQSLEEKDEDGNPVTWRDIGDKRAVEKTSQALREGQPKLLKKLAQRQDDTAAMPPAASGMNALQMQMNGFHGHHHNMGVGAVPQAQMMPQYGQMQQMQQQQQIQQQQVQVQQQQMHQIIPDNNFNLLQAGVQMMGQQQPQQQPLVDNGFQAQQTSSFRAQQRGSFVAQQRPSLTLASLIEGQTLLNSHLNGVVENNNNNFDLSRAGSQMSNGHDSWHDSWGSSNPIAPLPTRPGDERPFERADSKGTRDSWGDHDPMPLPFVDPFADDGFSSEDHKQLMTCLGVEGGDASVSVRSDHKRPSVKFQLPQRTSVSAMSLTSHLSELSIFSDALSLDSAMEARQREAEWDMLGDFDGGEMSIGTFESPESGSILTPNKPRRSILRKSNKWTSQGPAFPTAPLTQQADPGLMFTSTLDAKPGGVNAGLDVSGILGERRKSAVAFEIDVNRRRSSRMSLCSALTDFSGAYRRDIGSVLSIQSADFREILADIDDDDDSSIEGNPPGNQP